MDRESIYLEVDEEITSVVDKLKGAEGSILDIVIPKEALMLQSVINLKLLKKQAESLGKEITIVTQDKIGQKLAEKIGIPVVAKEGQVPKEVNISEVEKPSFTEDDIELKPKKENKEKETNDKGSESKEIIEEIKKSDLGENEVKKPKVNWLKKHWKGSLIAGGFLLLGLAIFAYIYVPLANIHIKLAAEKKTVDFTFIADKSISEVDTDGQKIPAREVVEEVEKTEEKKATGKKTVGEKAAGLVTIVNHEYSTNAFTITAGTRVVASSGLTYKTKTNVTVPGYTKIGVDITDGTASVGVVAEEIGEKYNVNGGMMTIPALLVSGVTSADIYADGGAFTGGSARDITYVTASDISEAQEALTTIVEDEIKAKIEEGLAENEILLDKAIKYTEVSAKSSIASGVESETFQMTVKLTGTALIVTEDSLKRLAEDVLQGSIGSEREIVEADSLITSTNLTELKLNEGIFEATLAGEAYIATKIDEETIKNSINGETEAATYEYLNNLEGVDEVQIKSFPGFYKRVPRINSHIYLKTEISKTQE